jgi:hypothetical protein
MNPGPRPSEKVLPFVFLDQATLEKSRALLHSKNAPEGMKKSYQHVLDEAALALAEGPFSVMDKTMVPPSGDKHDYLSISPYWWPDPSKPDGLPWIRKDGITNPISKTPDTDSRRIGHFTRSVNALAIAYYFSGDEKYAERAIEYLRIWFLKPETRMNPNLNFAQGYPGGPDGRRSGLIDSRTLVDRVLDATVMLSTSKKWTQADEDGIHAWYGEYLNWLLTHKLPTSEAKSPNNHGSWHDLQVAGVSYFVGKPDVTKEMLETVKKLRIDKQFDADGTQPLELERTRPYHYSYFNLDALTQIALLGPKVGVDLWGYTSPKGVSLKTAIDKMAQYQDLKVDFPWEDNKEAKRPVSRMLPIYRRAALAYNDKALMDLSKTGDFSGLSAKTSEDLDEVWVERSVELLSPAF